MAGVSSHKEDFTMSTPVFEKDLTGLLVVDPYNDFISEGGILWPLVKEIAETVHCVPNMLAILQAARAAGVRVFFAPHHRDRGREDEIEGWKYIKPIQNFGHERRHDRHVSGRLSRRSIQFGCTLAPMLPHPP